MKRLLLFSVFALMVVSFSAGAFAQDGGDLPPYNRSIS